jgi:hypothetical protein
MSEKNIRWSSLIDWEKFYNSCENVSYESDKEEESEIKSFDINLIDFSLNNEKILNEINKILLIKHFNKYTTLEILKKQDLVSSYISKSIQNNLINKKFFIVCINFLKSTSEFLTKKISQSVFNHNTECIKKDKIIRSSYKFCNYKHNCTYNYEKGKKGCYADHYPHNMIYADCNALLFCINEYYLDDLEIQNKEIVRCINTISYVIRHMYDELNNLCLYSKRVDHDKFHFIKSNSKKFNNSKFKNVDI